MASGTANSSSRTRPDPGPRMHCDQVIDQQLSRTRRRVKMVDLGVIVMGLVGAVILYTLAVVLIDHWVVALSTTGRFLALVILLVGVGYYCARLVVPLLVRRINPGYAARAIEQSDPSLKNSLINFLMFRRDPTPTGRLVYRALQQRAALDLRQVNIDLAVDQSRLIHVGYLVVALMILFAGYTIFSPKDVFQTVQRVSLPWANIARPSRVQIDDIQPGDAGAILGTQVEISARILGANADDTVKLLYTTDDNQTVDRAVPMNPPETGQRYTCTIPADAKGIQQNLKYRIEAGDASSAEFQLTMMRIPSIVVDKIDYEYPAYTGMQPYTSEGEGEIRAVEGTIVTVHAKANHQIKMAKIVFDPNQISRTLNMKVDQETAVHTFPLVWDDSRNASEHASYQLEFEPELSVNTAHSIKSQLPAIHKILVTPDLPPEISILTPRSKQIDVPVNGMQLIEIRALDPDFGLTEITLQARTRGREDLTKTFPQGSQGRTGQVMQEFEFRPGQLNLQAGDRVTLWAVAKDNCTVPNEDRTPDYILQIVAADPTREDPAAGQEDNGDSTSSQEDSPNQQSMASQSDPQSGDDAQADPSQPDPSQPNQSTANDAQDPSGQQESGQQEKGQGENSNDGQSSSGDQGSESESGDASSGQPQSAQQGEETEGNQTGQGGQQENGSSGNDAGSQQGGNQGNTSGAPGSSGDSQGSSGSQSGGASGQPSPSSDGSNQDASGSSANGSPSAGNSGSSERGGDPGADGQPGSQAEPLHDGEAFERALEHMKNAGRKGNPTGEGQSTGQQQSEETQSPADPNSNTGQQQGADPQQNPNDGTGGQSQQDGSAGNDNRDQQTPQGSGSEMLNGSNQSDSQESPSSDSASNNASDDPGKKQEQMAGDGNNTTPQQGGGAASQDGQQPKGTEGTESSDNAATGAEEKQSGQGDEGQAGSGRPSEDEAGSTGSQKANRDTDKTQGQDDRDASKGGAQSPSQSKQQSDSQSDQGGDESGGGEQGGGQPANQPGRDSPGSNTSSDQGNTGSPESGQGDTADRGGDKQQSPDKTGQSGETPGDGSQSQASSEGEQQQPDGSMPQTPQTPVDPSKVASPSEANPQDPDNTTSGGLSSGTPDGGGIASNSMSLPSDSDREAAEADAANLEHASKATDLVLNHLRDQQDEPDPELLESLGWTKEELQAFVARWEAMRREAREQGGEAQTELDDALRSLGLRQTGPGRRASNADNDQYRGLQDSGSRSQPPADLLEQFNAYRKGAARGQRNGG